MLGGIEPEEVFTPRSPEVNTRMYIERPALEQALVNALKSTQHIIIHGESGTGKSWLYKKVFAEQDIYFEVANLANANRLGSITNEIKNVVDRRRRATITGFSESKSAKASAVFAEGELSHEKEYHYGTKEPFEECLELLRESAGPKRTAVLVLDNLETIFDSPDRMAELADLVILSTTNATLSTESRC